MILNMNKLEVKTSAQNSLMPIKRALPNEYHCSLEYTGFQGKGNGFTLPALLSMVTLKL